MKVAIIGAGPIGLYAAGLLEERKIDYTVFEADSFIGGQLTHLYPEKLITNIPGIKEIKAKEYINFLAALVDKNKIKLNSKISKIEELDDFDYILVATGLGEYVQRKLGLENEEKYNVLYSLQDYSFLAGKEVVIFGGGDSALDWARQLSPIASVSLVHRRDEFRGNKNTIEGCKLDLYLSYVPELLSKGDVIIKSVKDGSLVTIPYDYILVNFGIQMSKSSFNPSTKAILIGDAIPGSKTIAAGNERVKKIIEKIISIV